MEKASVVSGKRGSELRCNLGFPKSGGRRYLLTDLLLPVSVTAPTATGEATAERGITHYTWRRSVTRLSSAMLMYRASPIMLWSVSALDGYKTEASRDPALHILIVHGAAIRKK